MCMQLHIQKGTDMTLVSDITTNSSARRRRRRVPRVSRLTPLQQGIVESIRTGKSLMGEGGVLTDIIKGALEAALEGEIESHFATDTEGYVWEEEAGDTYPDEPIRSLPANRRNGHGTKQVVSQNGTFVLATPRDRNGTFEPQIVKKRQTVLTEELDIVIPI